MNKIKVLAPQEIQKIAAGEVVERPANVVKELVENSLDAGATAIEIRVTDGGRSQIRVIDNGCGMSVEDARMSIVPHATSKIVAVEDLQTVATFGFRGEALASICSVSAITLKTKQVEDDAGVQLCIVNGRIDQETPVSCQDGTDITIDGIFDNMPARKKFLKAAETELRHIVQLFQAFVLSHQHVHFKLYNEDRLVHNCPSTDNITTRFVQLWDHYIADRMLAVDQHDAGKGIGVRGLVSNHQLERYNTAQLFFFVNKRWVKNITLTRALMRGYNNVLSVGRYPAAALFLTIDPAVIDVNIHPRKEEVQFLNERTVEQAVQSAVKQVLEAQVTKTITPQVFNAESVAGARDVPTPSTVVSGASPAPSPHPVSHGVHPEALEWVPFHANQSPRLGEGFSGYTERAAPLDGPVFAAVQERVAAIFEQPTAKPESQAYRLIGQYHNTYIMLETEDGLVLIDQHAAHERILYEQFAQRFNNIPSVESIFPHLVVLSTQDVALLVEHMSVLAAHGIAIDAIASDRVAVRSVPVSLNNSDMSELIRHIAGLLSEGEIDPSVLHERIRAQMACKAAVKAGDELSVAQMHELISQLAQTNNRLTCPHGRPTTWVIGLPEIERKFKRIV